MKLIRYRIQTTKPGIVLRVDGLVQHIAAPQGNKAEIVVYVDADDNDKFQKLVEGNPVVVSYRALPLGERDFAEEQKKGAAK